MYTHTIAVTDPRRQLLRAISDHGYPARLRDVAVAAGIGLHQAVVWGAGLRHLGLIDAVGILTIHSIVRLTGRGQVEAARREAA